MNFNDIAKKLVEFPAQDKKLTNQLIRDAIKDICKETWIWTEYVTFLTAAGTKDYTLTPSTAKTKILGIPERDSGVQIATVNTPQPSATDGTGAGALTPGTDYSYQVTAYRDDYGETLPCAVVTHECPATGVINLDWDAVDGHADGYYVYGNNGAGSTYTRMTDTTDTDYDDDGSDAPDGATEPPTTSELMREIGLTTNAAMRARNVTWRPVESDGITALIFDGIDSVRTNRIPETSGIGFQVKIALSPTTGYTDIPAILEPHDETILEYVRYRIYTHRPPTKDWPWLNYTLGKKCYAEYVRSRSLLKTRAMSGHGGTMRVKMRRFV